MHNAQNYINTQIALGPPSQFLNGYIVTPADAANLKACLEQDALSYTYSSCVSFLDALHGIQAGFYSWSTVKLYYSSFYSFRAMLALAGLCLYYQKSTPFSLSTTPGTPCKKESGVTHKVVVNLFGTHLGRHLLLSQTIALVSPTQWMMDRREEANYKNGKFYDPVAPEHLEKIVDIGIRRAVEAYASDTTSLYLFDPDHAIVAYPLAAISELCQRLPRQVSKRLNEEDANFLRNAAKDRSGFLPALHRLFSLLE